MSEIRNTQQQVNKKKYDENFDAIFRKPRNRVRCRKCSGSSRSRDLTSWKNFLHSRTDGGSSSSFNADRIEPS